MDELKALGYERLVGTNARIWLPEAGKAHDHHELASGWGRVIGIGKEVTLGSGIAAPTPTAAPVMAVFVTTQSDLFAFQLDGKSELEMTKTHPVWCETRNGWVLAGALQLGDRIRTATGASCISGIRLAQAGATVYNLSVAGGATFFVGDEKSWVHNCGVLVPWVGKKVESQLAKRGWTKDEIWETTNNSVPEIVQGKKGDAWKFTDPVKGRSLVLDPKNGEIFHVGAPGFLY